MAKKNGKQAPQAAPEATAPAAEQGGKEKQPNVFLNRVSEKMIKDVANAKDGKDWTNVRFGVMHEGQQAIGSILVRSNQVFDSTKKGADGATVPNDGFKNVLLGQPNQHYNVSLNQKDAEGNYINVRMRADEIKTANDEANKAYRAEKKAEKQAEGREGVQAAGAAAPEAEMDLPS